MSDMTNAVEHSEVAVPFLARVPVRVTVSVEAAIYVALGVVAMVMRLAELDTIPLNNAEAREALAAWHVVRLDAPGSAPLATSPLMFALNSLLMTFFGGTELTARLMTALDGTALALLPALWRRVMGRAPALAAAVFLIFSPSALTTARTMSPAVWSMVLAVIGLWLIWRFVEGRNPAYAVGATVAGAGVLLLADPAGFVLLAILGVAWLVAVRLSADDAPEDQPAPVLRAALAEWPWRDAALAAGLAVLLVGTLVFLYPRGLAQVGALLERGVEGLLRRPEGHPFAFPLLAALLYEPALWLLGAIGVNHAWREDRFWGRFLVGWLLGGLLASLVYPGAGPDQALWLVIPLAALAGDGVARALEPVRDSYWTVPSWAIPTLALGMVALLAMIMVNFLRVARALLLTTGPQFDLLRALLLGMALLLLVILFFLAGSLWGARAAMNGLVVALALFLGVYDASCAWRLAVTHIDDPRELWHVAPVSRHLGLLRDTLIDASARDTGTPDRMAFVAQVPDDGALAWQMRDYADLEYVPAIGRRTAAPVIVAPDSFQPEALGARYVGQDFAVTHTWNLGDLRWEDLPVWIIFGEAQAPPQVGERAVVWLRDDIYGLPPAEPESGEESTP